MKKVISILTAIILSFSSLAESISGDMSNLNKLEGEEAFSNLTPRDELNVLLTVIAKNMQMNPDSFQISLNQMNSNDQVQFIQKKLNDLIQELKGKNKAELQSEINAAIKKPEKFKLSQYLESTLTPQLNNPDISMKSTQKQITQMKKLMEQTLQIQTQMEQIKTENAAQNAVISRGYSAANLDLSSIQ